MKAAEVRKTIVAVLTGAATVGGMVLNASLLHGDAARWVGVAIAVIGSVVASISVYTVPNGATMSQRVQALEAVAVPLAREVVTDLHAGLSGPKGKWPTEGPLKPDARAFHLEGPTEDVAK